MFLTSAGYQILGMMPDEMLLRADQQHRLQFFEQVGGRWTIKQRSPDATPSSRPSTPVVPSTDPVASLKDVVEKEASKKKRYSSQDTDHSARQYGLFVDLIYRMLMYNPSERIRPDAALDHPFITDK